MKRIIFGLVLLATACNNDKDEKKSDVVTVNALSLEGFEGTSVQSGCDFSTSFVSWFVEKYASDIKVIDGQCADSNSENLPEDFAMMKDKCKNICSVYVFNLQGKDSQQHKYYSIVTKTVEGQRFGLLSQFQAENYALYLTEGTYNGAEYRDNLSKSPSENLPLITLTFEKAVHVPVH